MKTFKATEDFYGYPEGAKEGSKKQFYKKGEEYEVNNTFHDLVVEKGQGKDLSSETTAEKPTARREDPGAAAVRASQASSESPGKG
jgi:hypothetical protein